MPAINVSQSAFLAHRLDPLHRKDLKVATPCFLQAGHLASVNDRAAHRPPNFNALLNMNRSIQHPCALLRQRKTVPLTGTMSKLNTCLDFQSVLALDYAQAWLGTASPLKVPVSGLMRRALTLYMQHLAKDTTEARDELIAVRRACASRLPDEADQQAALQRLQAIQAGEALLTFADVLEGPGAGLRHASEDEAYGRLLDEVMASPRARFFNRRANQAEANG